MASKEQAEAIVERMKNHRIETIRSLNSALRDIKNGEWGRVPADIQYALKKAKKFKEEETTYRRFYSKDFGDLDLEKL